MFKVKYDTEKDNEKYTRTLYIAPGKNGAKVHLSSHDIYKIAVIVNEVIFKLYPSLKKIYDYLLDISKLMIKLGIPLTWITPTGMKITQHYLISKRKTIPIQFAGHTNKMVLKERTDKLNVNKQIGSIIPNTIHSLDSAHLM
jgi:DNA-directed RNA polymerase